MFNISVATAGVPTDSATSCIRSAASFARTWDCAKDLPNEETDSFALFGNVSRYKRASAGDAKKDTAGVVFPTPGRG